MSAEIKKCSGTHRHVLSIDCRVSWKVRCSACATAIGRRKGRSQKRVMIAVVDVGPRCSDESRQSTTAAGVVTGRLSCAAGRVCGQWQDYSSLIALNSHLERQRDGSLIWAGGPGQSCSATSLVQGLGKGHMCVAVCVDWTKLVQARDGLHVQLRPNERTVGLMSWEGRQRIWHGNQSFAHGSRRQKLRYVS